MSDNPGKSSVAAGQRPTSLVTSFRSLADWLQKSYIVERLGTSNEQIFWLRSLTCTIFITQAHGR